MLKAYMFDCEGKMLKQEFETEEEVAQFCENHGLELFKTEVI